MICAIILAAGRSRRMGRQKLLLPWAGKTMIGHIVDEVLAGGIQHVVVVVGADRSAVRGALVGRAVSLVDNPDPDGDMLSSIRCGLQALPSRCEAALIALGDQPGINADLVSRLLQVYRESQCGIAAPIFDGKRGHPVIISSKFFSEVLSGYDGLGLHGLMQSHPKDVRTFNVSDANLLTDIDFPQEYEEFINSAKERVLENIR